MASSTHSFRGGVFVDLDAFLLGAPPEILKLRLSAQETVLQFGFFGGQLFAFSVSGAV